MLHPDIPTRMFVTCLYGVLDPATGRIRFANAGHNLPLVRTDAGATELRATGMPLGLLPGMRYEEVEARLAPGQQLVLHSDGIAEAHNPDREMFGVPRLCEVVAEQAGGPRLIQGVLDALERFTGYSWEQEDDITLLAISREPAHTLDAFELPSEQGGEREAISRVAAAVAQLDLPPDRLEKLKTAVAEATMNAIEHGNEGRAELPVEVRVEVLGSDLVVAITDQGGDQQIPITETPDIEAKLAGRQTPRGWGLFLIQNMVDALRVTSDGERHTAELVMHLKGASDG
jgi:anti-sigma regulatory factor (Ser/Thr protein kinase)